MVAQGVSFSDTKDLTEIPPRSLPTRAPNIGWVSKVGSFWLMVHNMSETVQDRTQLLWKAYRKVCVDLSDGTISSDLDSLSPPHFNNFWSPSLSLQQVKLLTSNLVNQLTVAGRGICTYDQKTLKGGVTRITWPFLNFEASSYLWNG